MAMRESGCPTEPRPSGSVVLPSRDRQGAVASLSGCIRDEDRHGFALLLDDIPNRFPNILVLPQPSRASVACPASGDRSVASQPVQTSARVGFEIIHDFLGLNFGLHDYVHMIRAHMRGQKTPSAV